MAGSSRADGHTAVVNSRALDVAGIDADTAQPPGGFIDRNRQTRKPTGSLQETATDLVERHVPAVTRDDRRAALEYARDMLHAFGITALQTGYTRPESLPFIAAPQHGTEVTNPEQRITAEQAIEAFTINAAFVNHIDNVTGSIEVGKFADLIVLDQDLLKIDLPDISDSTVLLTLFEGRPVHGSLDDL